jgi:hypothetical protein
VHVDAPCSVGEGGSATGLSATDAPGCSLVGDHAHMGHQGQLASIGFAELCGFAKYFQLQDWLFGILSLDQIDRFNDEHSKDVFIGILEIST